MLGDYCHARVLLENDFDLSDVSFCLLKIVFVSTDLPVESLIKELSLRLKARVDNSHECLAPRLKHPGQLFKAIIKKLILLFLPLNHFPPSRCEILINLTELDLGLDKLLTDLADSFPNKLLKGILYLRQLMTVMFLKHAPAAHRLIARNTKVLNNLASVLWALHVRFKRLLRERWLAESWGFLQHTCKGPSVDSNASDYRWKQALVVLLIRGYFDASREQVLLFKQ